MRKNLSVLLAMVLIWTGIFSLTETARAASFAERIKDFHSEIEIKKDGSLSIKEDILYDFGENLRHGIYRNIPMNKTEISVEKVVDESGGNQPFKTSKEAGSLKIKIGDPDKLIKGEHLYIIHYRIQGGIRFFNDHYELYWNITGNEWEVPIDKSQAEIILPEIISPDSLKFACYTGNFGSKEISCQWRREGEKNVIFESQRSFSPKEGLTVVLGWPKGFVKEPGFFQKILLQIKNFWPLLIPAAAFIFIFKKWLKEGRDPKMEKTIIAQYEPPDDLRPAEIKAIMRQQVETKDISASLIDLAVRGYIKIKETQKTGLLFSKKDYELIIFPKAEKYIFGIENSETIIFPKAEKYIFGIENSETIKLKDFDEGLRFYEKKILNKIFDSKKNILISELAEKDFDRVRNDIFDQVASSGYFVSNPGKITKAWVFWGIMTIILGGFLFSFIRTLPFLISFITGGMPPDILSILLTIIAGLLFIIFAPFMPKRTAKGAEACWRALGFKEYIKTAEKYRAQFQEKENIFEKYLPYAIAFGLVHKWAKAFEGIYTAPPTWYEGSAGPHFTAIAFANSLDHSLSAFDKAFAPAGGTGSGFGGGGFAGGGGGGGGGGSW